MGLPKMTPAACIIIWYSLVPTPKEEGEEKGPGFSRSRMRLIISDLPRVEQWEGANDTFKVTRSIA